MHKIFEEAFERLLSGQEILDLAKPIIREIRYNSNRYHPTWHALGFIHCKVANFDGGQLRLHIWPAGKSHHLEQDLKVHEHVFDVNSCLVRGKLLNINYEFNEALNADRAHFQRYSVEYLEDGSMLHPSGRFFNIKEKVETELSTGDFYRVGRGIFHESKRELTEQVVTLVATSAPEERSPLMMGAAFNVQSKFRPRVICQRNTFNEEIDSVLNYFDGHSG